uniref:RNA-directed DNA polymerase n=1 Tax=Heligmosomoides polygyrus TaxID=6339 RepID=A0A183GV98_HELPZ
LLNTGDLDMEAPLPPVPFDAVRAVDDRCLHEPAATTSALGEQGQRPKSIILENWSCHATGVRQQGNEIFGPKTTCEVQLLGRSYRALVDTESQVSILPLDTLTTASKSGFDLDADVEEVELDSRTHIYDASGNRMSFKGAVRLTLSPKDGPEERVVFLVKKGTDDTIVLGTNILDKIGVQASPTAQQRPKSRTIGTQTGEQGKGSWTTAGRQEGHLCFLDKECTRRVLPRSCRRKLFDDAHSALLAGHFAPRKVLRTLSKRMFWENMARDIKLWSEECKKCTLFNAQPKMTPPLKPIITSEPYEVIGIDILEMGPTSNGNRYILTVIDHFTKYGAAYPIATKAAEVVARTLFERWIADGCRIPKRILSDQGGEFDNKLMTELTATMGIEQIFTKGYNPRENGITERFNRTVIGMLRKKVEIPLEWDRMLPHCMVAYNTTSHEATADSPFFLLHGFDAKVPWQTMPDREITPYMVDLDDYAHELVSGLKLARQNARERNDLARTTMKKSYDSRSKVHEDKELAHPDLFPTSPGYDIEMYYRMAMAGRSQIISQAPDDMPGNPIMIALPKHFGRVLTDFLEPATVKFLVYSHFGDLADQLQKQCISSAFVWVWPNEVQITQHMLLVQQAVERHLQCGGTMELFPPPFELSREKEWRHIGRVCREMATFLSGPARGFDARIVDFYSTITARSQTTFRSSTRP